MAFDATIGDTMNTRAWFWIGLGLLVACEGNPLSSEELLSKGLQRALPDDQLGQTAHLERLLEKSPWNLTRGWEGALELRTETTIDATIQGERREVETRTVLQGHPLRSFLGEIQWSGVDYSLGQRERLTRLWKDEEGLWVQEGAQPFLRIHETEPGFHRQTLRLLESWERVLDGLGEGLQWTERETSARGGSAVLFLDGVCKVGEPFRMDQRMGNAGSVDNRTWIVREGDGELVVEAGSGKLQNGVLSVVLSNPSNEKDEVRLITRFSVKSGSSPMPPQDLSHSPASIKVKEFGSAKALIDSILKPPSPGKEPINP